MQHIINAHMRRPARASRVVRQRHGLLAHLRASRLVPVMALVFAIVASARGLACASVWDAIADMAAFCGTPLPSADGEGAAPAASGDACLWCAAATASVAPTAGGPDTTIVRPSLPLRLAAAPERAIEDYRAPRGPPSAAGPWQPTRADARAARAGRIGRDAIATPALTQIEIVPPSGRDRTDPSSQFLNRRETPPVGTAKRLDHAMLPAVARPIGDPMPGFTNGG